MLITKKDFEFLQKYINNPDVEISDEIRNAFYLYKNKLTLATESEVFKNKDYLGFIGKLKEKKFIEQFEITNEKFKANKFYLSLEKSLKKENILFDDNFDTTVEQIKIIDKSVKNILCDFLVDTNVVWLIRAYVVGRSIYYKDKYKNDIPTLNEITYSNNEKLQSSSIQSHIICLSFKGCCEICTNDIVGKVFKISNAPVLPYKNCISELCLCTLVPFNPKFQYISTNGEIKLRIESEDDWAKWYSANISSEENKRK